MPGCTYRGRRALSIENAHLRLTMLVEGGHIAEVFDKRTGINPLWTPPWESIEPSTFDLSRHGWYGGAVDGRLLAGIMGHNLCLDIFGGPSLEEAAAGLGAHGEASVVAYGIEANESNLIARLLLCRVDDLGVFHDPREMRELSVDLTQAALAVDVIRIFRAVAERCRP